MTFRVRGKVDVRAFREDNNYIVDVDADRRARRSADKRDCRPLAWPKSRVRSRRTCDRRADTVAERREPTPPDAAAGRGRSRRKPQSRETEAPMRPPAADEPSRAGAACSAEASRNAARVRPGASAARRDRCRPRRWWSKLRRQGDGLRLTFPFAAPTPAAVFRRADTLWLVFDSQAPIDIAHARATIRPQHPQRDVTRAHDGQVVRLKLERPRLDQRRRRGGRLDGHRSAT